MEAKAIVQQLTELAIFLSDEALVKMAWLQAAQKKASQTGQGKEEAANLKKAQKAYARYDAMATMATNLRNALQAKPATNQKPGTDLHRLWQKISQGLPCQILVVRRTDWRNVSPHIPKYIRPSFEPLVAYDGWDIEHGLAMEEYMTELHLGCEEYMLAYKKSLDVVEAEEWRRNRLRKEQPGFADWEAKAPEREEQNKAKWAAFYSSPEWLEAKASRSKLPQTSN